MDLYKDLKMKITQLKFHSKGTVLSLKYVFDVHLFAYINHTGFSGKMHFYVAGSLYQLMAP